MRVKLKDVCTFYTGTGFPKKYQGQLSGTYPFYKVGDIANNVVSGKVYLEQCNNYISEETLELIKGSIVPKNIVVFAKIGEALKLNRRAITSTDCLIDNNAMGIAAKSDKLRTLFFYYFMRNIKMELLAESTTVPSVRKSRLEAYEIDIPSLDEQEIIERKLTILSKIINLKEKQLLKLDELVKARFMEMFGDPNHNPKGYKKDIIKDHIDLLSGYPFKSENYVDTGINICGGLVIMPQKIKWEECVHWKSAIGYENYLLDNNDIVMALDRPWISEGFKIAKVDSKHLPALLIQRTVRIRAIDMDQDYLYYCFICGGFNKHCNVTGSLVPHISSKDIKSFEVMLPPLELQNQFASFVEEIDKSRSRIQKSLEASQELFDSLMQDYFG